jgi:thymidylate kinase
MLQIYDRLFDGFAREGVQHSIFKGLDHLDEDLLGSRGDVDIWVAEENLDAAVRVALDAGFFRVRWSYQAAVAFVMIGWDVASGAKVLIHLHHAPIALKKRSLALLVFRYRSLPTLTQADTRPVLADAAWIERFEADRRVMSKSGTLRLLSLAFVRRRELAELGFRFSFGETVRTYVSYVHRFVFLRGRFRIVRRGLLLSFTGIDGAGKSSVVEHIGSSDFLKTTEGTRVAYFGNHSFWIPGLARGFARYRRSKGLGVIVLGLSVIDRKLRIIPALAARRSGRIVLCDRYFYDQNVSDPTENYLRGKTLKAIVNPFVSWIPALPDVGFYLRVDPAVALARKPEHSLEKLHKASADYDAALLDRHEVRVLDAAESLDDVLAQVRAAIAERLVRR